MRVMMDLKRTKAWRDYWFAFHEFEPHDAQKRLLDLYDKHRFTVAVCGRRWGKTELLAKIAETVLLQPNKRIGIAAPTTDACTKIFKVVFDDIVKKYGLIPQQGSANSQYNHIIITDKGSEIHTISTDSITSPTSTRGLGDEYDLLILDEAAKMLPTAWSDYLRPSLSTRRGKAVFITTPWGFNHIYDLFVLGQDDEDGVWGSMQSPTWENTVGYSGEDDPEIAEYRKNNSKESYLQNYGAQFTAMGGKVFGDFTREEHVKDIKYEATAPLYISIDWGYNHPSVSFIQTVRENSRETIKVIDEIEGSQLTDEQLFNAIQDKIKKNKYNVTAWVGDSSGSNAQSQTGIGPITYFKSKGVRIQVKTDKVSKSIAAGLDHIRRFIKNADGDVSFYVDEGCKGLIRSFEGYIYAAGKGGNAKDTPLKDNVHDHFPDVIRYFTVWKYPLKGKMAVGYSNLG